MSKHTFLRQGVYLLLIAIFNMVIYFDVQQYYIRHFYTFLFLITIPGSMILTAFGLRIRSQVEYFLYCIGTSIAFLLFGGWFLNMLFPGFGVAKPLTMPYVSYGLNTSLVVLLLAGLFRSVTNSFEKTISVFRFSEILFHIVPFILLVMSIFGAILLNNGGSNYLTMTMLIGIAMYMVTILCFGKRLKTIVYPFALFCISLALLFMLSLRSQYITGWDINGEFNVFQLTKNAGLWNISKYQNAYYGCLSITILPTLFSLFSTMADGFIYKIFYQIVFALIPVVLFQTSKKYLGSRLAFLSIIYVIMQPFFIQPMAGLMRQEVAFFFFSLMIMTLFSKNISTRSSRVLFLVFGCAMVVSHYSTTYISLLLFTGTYLGTKLIQIAEKLKQKSNQMRYFISFPILLLLVLFTFFWNVQLTKTTGNIHQVVIDTLVDMKDVFTGEIKSEETVQALSLFGSPNINKSEVMQNYIASTENRFSLYKEERYAPETYADYRIVPIHPLHAKPLISTEYNYYIQIGLILLKQVTKLFVFIGTFYLLFRFLKQNTIDREYILLIFISTVTITFMLIHPSIGVKYNISRVYLQTLFVQHVAALYGSFAVLLMAPRIAKLASTTIIYIIMFLTFSGILPQIFGGEALMHLNNYGEDYDKFYFTGAEVQSARWLKDNKAWQYPIFADNLSSLRIQYAMQTFPNTAVLPQFIYKDSYVYGRSANIQRLRTDASYDGKTLTYYFPLTFLSEQKNKIYNNSSSQIFR